MSAEARISAAIIVLDEAHHLENVATAYLGATVTPFSFYRSLGRLQSHRADDRVRIGCHINHPGPGLCQLGLLKHRPGCAQVTHRLLIKRRVGCGIEGANAFKR